MIFNQRELLSQMNLSDGRLAALIGLFEPNGEDVPDHRQHPIASWAAALQGWSTGQAVPEIPPPEILARLAAQLRYDATYVAEHINDPTATLVQGLSESDRVALGEQAELYFGLADLLDRVERHRQELQQLGNSAT